MYNTPVNKIFHLDDGQGGTITAKEIAKGTYQIFPEVQPLSRKKGSKIKRKLQNKARKQNRKK